MPSFEVLHLDTTRGRPHHNRLCLAPNDMKLHNWTAGDLFVISKTLEDNMVGVAWPDKRIPSGCVGIFPGAQDCLLAQVGDCLELIFIDDVAVSTFVSYKVEGEPLTLLEELLLKECLLDLTWVSLGQLIPTSVTSLKKDVCLTDLSHGLSTAKITFNTKLHCIHTPPTSPSKEITLGALSSQESCITEMINFCFQDAIQWTSKGIKPPRGVLLHGPSGTGKTLLAQKIVSQLSYQHIYTTASEMTSKYYGQVEENLAKVFSDARRRQPCVLILDDIHVLCQSREKSEDELSRRTVATLLMLLDGIQSSVDVHERVFVIGITNKPNDLDEALRRPGRFDLEIETTVPTPVDRFDILQSLLKVMSHSLTEQEIKSMTDPAHGFVGADLSALCREAGLVALKRLSKEKIDEELSNEPCLILHSDFQIAIKVISPSAVREVLVQVPNVKWTDIGGQEDVKQKLKEAVEWPLKHPEAFQRFNIRPPKGVLLFGPPGCSKTLTAKALATEAGLNFLAVKGPELFSKWVGESEKAVQRLFQKARAAAPSIIFFDEIDALAVRRGGEDSSVADRVLSQLLSELDGIEPLVSVTILAATNRPDILDSALLRPGRIDSILYVGPPNLSSRSHIFEIQFKKMAIAPDVLSSELADLTSGFSGAEVVAVCQKASLKAMERDLNATHVEKRDFLSAISTTTKRITPDMISFYDSFKTSSGLVSI